MSCFPDVHAPFELSVFTFVMSIVLSILVISSNATIVITVVKDPLKKLHNPFYYFVINLAVSDLILGAVTMPISAYAHYTEAGRKLDVDWVKALHMSYFISATASLLNLILLSLDRFVAITYNSNYKMYTSKNRCILASVVIWVFSFSFPFIYFEWNYIGYLMFFAHSTIFVGLVFIIVISICIPKFLRKQSNKMVMNISSSSPSGAAEKFASKELLVEKKVTRTMLIILSAFVGFYIPAVIMIYILHFCATCDCTFRHVLRDMQFLLISANSCINPFIYAMRIKQVRDSIKATFCKRNRRRVSQNTATSGTSEIVVTSSKDLRDNAKDSQVIKN